MTKRFARVCVALLLTGACGTSSETAQTADQMAKAAGQATADAASGKASNVKVVPFEQLQALLPSLPGWTRGEPTGETVTEGVAISRTQANYDKGDGSLSLEIMDSSMNQALLAPMMAMLKPGYDQRTVEGYKKATTIGGFPGAEEWTVVSKHGVVTAVVNERFFATATGDGVDIDTVRKAVEAIDLKKLAALK
jgi:hypothetical protein